MTLFKNNFTKTFTETLPICFKGERDYLHGTDIIQAIWDHCLAADWQHFDIKFNGLSRHALRWVAAGQDPSAPVSLRWQAGESVKQAQLWPTSEVISCRQPFDEDKIDQACVLEPSASSLTLTADTGYRWIDNLVIMNKLLLHTLLPEAPGKWLFTRLVLTQAPPKPTVSTGLTLVFKKNFHYRLTQTDIVCDGVCIGQIYFSLQKE